jgi:hypothetical protein
MSGRGYMTCDAGHRHSLTSVRRAAARSFQGKSFTSSLKDFLSHEKIFDTPKILLIAIRAWPSSQQYKRT